MKAWQKKERNDKKSFGGAQTKRSGGLWFDPGDVKTKDFLIDSKTTKAKSFSITKKMWAKIRKEALNNNRKPCLSIGFLNEENPLDPPTPEVVVLDKNDFESWFKEQI